MAIAGINLLISHPVEPALNRLTSNVHIGSADAAITPEPIIIPEIERGGI
jgi:hypothetical protein